MPRLSTCHSSMSTRVGIDMCMGMEEDTNTTIATTMATFTEMTMTMPTAMYEGIQGYARPEPCLHSLCCIQLCLPPAHTHVISSAFRLREVPTMTLRDRISSNPEHDGQLGAAHR